MNDSLNIWYATGIGYLRAVSRLWNLTWWCSTLITAKNYFTEKPATNFMEQGPEVKEWIILHTPWKKRYTKEEIIAQYLNQITFFYIQCRWGEVSITSVLGKNQKILKGGKCCDCCLCLRILDSTILREISKKNRSRASSFSFKWCAMIWWARLLKILAESNLYF
jgi:hypothetical protein